jgi:bifunctional DNA-binding transcriptional regulator/antitoxin component of YhaV-PrlF toxin-antitoxin module
MARMLAKLGEGGRLVIPAEYRKAMGVDTGDELVLVLEEKTMRVLTPQEGIRRAQDLLRSYLVEDEDGRPRLSDELIADRRRDSELE